MLKQRITTAVLMLLVFLPALWSPLPQPFQLLLAFVLAAAVWEWGRLNALSQFHALALASVWTAALGAWLVFFELSVPAWVWLAPVAVWFVGGAWVLSVGPTGWLAVPQWVRVCLGCFLLTMAVMAILKLKTFGALYLLSVFLVVWGADVFAYFGGKALGRHKLAPSISPGKSWEGVFFGMAGVCVMAWIWLSSTDRSGAAQPGNFFSHLNEGYGFAMWGVLLVVVGMSVVGDLAESLVKRQAGVKDSSHLLPGHGGVLDRIDALLPVLPLIVVLTEYA